MEAESAGLSPFRQTIEFPDPDFAAIARACGAHGFTMAKPPGVLTSVMHEAFVADGPPIVDCIVAADEMPNLPHVDIDQAAKYALAEIREAVASCPRQLNCRCRAWQHAIAQVIQLSLTVFGKLRLDGHCRCLVSARTKIEGIIMDLSSISTSDLADRIAILRDNIRQITERAAAESGAADEERNANLLARQTEELDALLVEQQKRLAK